MSGAVKCKDYNTESTQCYNRTKNKGIQKHRVGSWRQGTECSIWLSNRVIKSARPQTLGGSQ